MKKFLSAVLTIIIIVLLTGCNNNTGFMSYNSEEYIKLEQYSGIEISEDFVKISQSETKSIVQMELSSNEAYVKIPDRQITEEGDIVLLNTGDSTEYAFIDSDEKNYKKMLGNAIGDIIEIEAIDGKNIKATILGIYRLASYGDTDFVLNYYKCSTMEELNTFIKNRAREEIIYNYVFDKLCKNSKIIKYPEEIQEQIEKDEIRIKEEILKHYSSLDEYLNENETTYEELKNNIASNYYETMIFKAILDNENISVSENDIDIYINDNKIGNDYTKYDVYKILAEETARKIIVNKAIII